MSTIYYARWLLAPDGEVLENAAVSIDGSIITGVGNQGKVVRRAGDRMVNLGNLLLLPGLINIHTHLEESVVRGNYREPEETFAAYYAKKATRIKQFDDAPAQSCVRLNARELLSRGITTVVDSSRKGISPGILANEPIRAWVIHEVHAEESKDEDDIIKGLLKRIDLTPAHIKAGLGPYALFSLSVKGHHKVIELSRKKAIPWTIHIAESSEEVQAFSEQSGDLFFLLTRRRPWEFEKISCDPVSFALSIGAIPDNAICYHCNYADGNDLAMLAAKNCSLVLCPLYTEMMGHKVLPIDVALNRGISVCIATESIADSNSSSLFDELFLLKTQYPHITAQQLLRFVTQNPATALGVGSKLGSLAPGKLADMIGVGFPSEPGSSVLEELIQIDPAVKLAIVNGEEVIAGY